MAGLRRHLLSDDIRLVTLTGVAGSGKTRLALEVARGIGDRFADGVCFVGLDSVADASDVRGAILRAIVQRDGKPYPSRDNLVALLQPNHILLLLDNFEHLTDAAPVIAELLRACPGVKAMVTSRVALRLAVERIFEVPPLSLPDEDAGALQDSVDDRTSSEAVRLFVERARALDDRFDLADGNAELLAGVCRRLDGLPLAIELAAARIRVLSPREIMERLERPLDVLGGGSREAPLRHRTLRSTLEWSEDLLGRRERELFSRLAVFTGGCDLQAIEVVCATGTDETLDVVEHLSTLVDSSLLWSRDDAVSGRRRFDMLETVNAYALERLRKDPQEYERTQQFHAAYYLRLAERAASELLSADQSQWYRTLEIEDSNLRAALVWAREYGEAELGLRLAVAIWRSWEARGQLEEGMDWLRTFLDLGREVIPYVRAEALYGAGMLACALGNHEEAEGFLENSLDRYRSDGNDAGVGFACNGLGVVAMRRGDYARAEELFGRSLAITEALGDEHRLAISAGNLGITRLYRGDLVGARRILSTNLDRCRALGLAQEEADSLNFLGAVALYENNPAEALTTFEESLHAARESGNLVCTIESTSGLGCGLLASGRGVEAEPHLAQSLRLAYQTGDIRRVVRVLDAFGCLASERDDPARANRLWTAAGQARADFEIVEHPVERMFHETWRSQAESIGAAAMTVVDEAVAFALDSPD